MKNSKNKKLFTYMVVGALVMALSISCKTDDGPTGTGATIQSHPAQGTYNNSLGDNATVTINDDGTCTITGKAGFTSGGQREYANFSIIVTKWYYLYSSYDIRNAGSSYKESEATINLPLGADFQVEYNVKDGTLYIAFGPEGKVYTTGFLKKQ